MDILVIDIGGSSVKLWHTGHQEQLSFESRKDVTRDAMVEKTMAAVTGWTFEACDLGTNRGDVVEGGRRLWEDLPDPSQASNGNWLIL